jgi:hypothetical protein
MAAKTDRTGPPSVAGVVLALPALASLGLSLTACTQASGPVDGLVGNWNLGSVIRTHEGTEISYAYPNVRQYSDCAKVTTAKLAVEDIESARMTIHDHYACMGEAENDEVVVYRFEVETIESGRSWYLYYLFDHDHPSSVSGDDQGDDDQGNSMPIPERELWYMCTADGDTLECDDMLLAPPDEQKLVFAYEDEDADAPS